MLHGGDYNPEQWLNKLDILEKDIELFKKAKINTVTLGVFSWSTIEPEEGIFHLEWLEKIINHLYDNGISTILATPSAARPKWMSDKYPEVLRTSQDRIRNIFGGRHNHCYTSPVYREKVAKINKKLAEKFASNPAVILWHISNEFGGECHCELCQSAFRDWLRHQYTDIKELNEKWCTTFWSHTYQSFEQIESPSSIGEVGVHGLNLAWRRFVTYQTVDFAKAEIEALKEAGARGPFTTNLMYNFKDINYDYMASEMDIVSWDSYPTWHKTDDILIANDTGFQHDYMRSLKHQPFLLMESCPTSTDWQGVSKLKKPGLLQAASLQAIAHGSDSVLYFQMRQSRGSSEKFHGAVINHYGGDDTRVFKEVTKVGTDLEKLHEVSKTTTKCETAVVYDVENRWALEDSQGPRNKGMHYYDLVMKSYRALKRQGLNVDVISAAQELKNYKLVIVPMMYMLRDGFASRLENFVASGGCALMSYWSGVVDENDYCFIGGTPHDLQKVFGIRSLEIDGLYTDESNYFRADSGEFKGKEYQCKHLCELIQNNTADVLMQYGSDFYEGYPAVTRNKYKDGMAYYIAADVEEKFYNELYSKLVKDLRLNRPVDGMLPEHIEICTRSSETHDYIFVQNFSNQATDISGLNLKGQLLLGTETDILDAYQTIIIKI